MAAITLERFKKELQKLHDQMIDGQLKHGEYDERLARTIGELRERGIEGERADIRRVLDEVLEKGIITPSVKTHLEHRLGLSSR